MPEFVTIPDVELFSVGMRWPASHGEITFRFDHLQDAVAAQNDPHIIRPRLTIGHHDETFNPDGEHHNPFVPLGDGYPALGSVENLRLVNDGATCVGDFVEVPEWFAEVLPSAYPNRSIEGAWLDGKWEVETPGGKKYGFVLTKVALLGIWAPAVEDLEDLRRFLVSGEGVVAGAAPEGGELAAPSMGGVEGSVAARADVDQVVEVFWRDFAQDDRYWWWPRAVWTDPNEIIADDDEGSLYRVPFTSGDDQEVTFGEPVRVLQQFTDAPAAAAAIATAAGEARHRDRPLATFTTRLEAGREARKEGGPTPSATTGDMDSAAELRKVLGLEEDATDEAVQTALAEREENGGGSGDESQTPPGEGGEGGEGEGAPDSGDGSGAPAGEGGESTEPPAAATTLPDGMVAVPADQWERVQKDATAGAQVADQAEQDRRDSTVASAIRDGKVRPADKPSLMNLHTSNREGFYTLLTATVEKGGLAPGLVPTSERGSSEDPAATATSGETSDAEMAALFGSAYAGGKS